MKILVVFDSRHGNTMRLAEAVAEGAQSVSGAEVRVKRAPAYGPESSPSKDEKVAATRKKFLDIPQVELEDFAWADGIALGSPTRFGNMTASLKAVIDGLSGLWMSGATIGKVAGCFCSTSSMHGGQETTLVSMWFPLIHLGMMVIGVPYSEQRLFSTTRGGSPYGPSSVSGPAANQGPDEDELAIAVT
ncbi:MAG: NAD(P)H:quinone oxidoreductase, partial [Armatimonadetes bacterium]|nr:NAD(P)H:quinone oxidoreductase [Armatimonadota bacterium]NIM23765.1 NAD(P)H:quinone oxidoreductase [Armatimonadota bacterium]NIM67642.1 NAD(P)H:quinone oxidoreductase [Armatimonadota bacterium]NIM76158.1 NAD(P)H:quinone oxidoreductase [Armatimonadota bacterium]NIN05843.1 NAD(P)H:quinone oxidoreductase [Armatimonadota bacterium]